VSDDKIIHFPTERIVNVDTATKQDTGFSKKVKEKQTRQFVETAVDDISMSLLSQFVNLAMKTQSPMFMKDLALLVDVMRGMIYRDFGLKHPAQLLSDQMVTMKENRGGQPSAKINYTNVIETKIKATTPLSKDVKNELKDINDIGVTFIPDTDLDD
jgi:hypothetical protein